MRCTLFKIVALLFAHATPALATNWNIRPWDELMSRSQVVDRIVGSEIAFMDRSVASYENNGRYIYTYNGGRAFTGSYEIEEDGSVCTNFDDGQRRCDLYVLHGPNLMLIAETGRRFQVRPSGQSD